MSNEKVKCLLKTDLENWDAIKYILNGSLLPKMKTFPNILINCLCCVYRRRPEAISNKWQTRCFSNYASFGIGGNINSKVLGIKHNTNG